MPTHCYECNTPLTGPVCVPCNENEKDRRIAELEAIAREIIKAHRDVETGLEVPKYIYKMAVAAIEK